MKVALLGLLIAAPAFTQVFTEDIEKINHFIAEEEINRSLKKMPEDGIPAEYLRSLVYQRYLDPILNCDENTFSARPDNVRYEVIAVIEDLPEVEDKMVSEIKVLVAKYAAEEENPLLETIKKIGETQKDNPGVINLKHNTKTGRRLLHYSNPNTSISFGSTVGTENKLELDVKDLKADTPSSAAKIKVDVINRVDIKQSVASDTSIKAGVEAIYSSGTQNLQTLTGVRMELTDIKADLRLDSEVDENTKAYTEIRYQENARYEDTRYLAGLTIKAPRDAQILVFTGHNTRKTFSGKHTLSRKTGKEIGVEYRNKKGVQFFGRIKEENDSNETIYETGVEVKFK
jgi:hypothetical protein